MIRDAAEAAKQLDNERPKHTLILVDEFQDTDRHQWDMLDHLYPDESDRLMVMVGDPKQAIYRFRGADTAFYHQIRTTLPEQSLWYLDTVYRSAQTVVDGLNALFDDNCPVGKQLQYQPLEAGRPHDIPPLTVKQQANRWVSLGRLVNTRIHRLADSIAFGGRTNRAHAGSAHNPSVNKICVS